MTANMGASIAQASDAYKQALLGKLDNVQIKLKDFYIHLKYITPKRDLQETLNKLLEQDNDIIQIFVNQIRVKMVLHNRNSSKLDITDVFNGQIPFLYVYFATRQDYFNGDPFVPPTRCSWEGLTNLHLTVHGQQRGLSITNSQQAYFHLRRVLHLNDNQEDEYAYIAHEVSATEDSNLKALLLNTKASLGVTA